MSTKNERVIYTRYEAAEALGISLSNFDDAKNANHLKVFKVGRRVFTTRADMEAYANFLKRQSDKGTPVMYRQRPPERLVAA